MTPFVGPIGPGKTRSVCLACAGASAVEPGASSGPCQRPDEAGQRTSFALQFGPVRTVGARIAGQPAAKQVKRASLGRSGGTGRRGGLKIRCSQGLVGSIPTFGTNMNSAQFRSGWACKWSLRRSSRKTSASRSSVQPTSIMTCSAGHRGRTSGARLE